MFPFPGFVPGARVRGCFTKVRNGGQRRGRRVYFRGRADPEFRVARPATRDARPNWFAGASGRPAFSRHHSLLAPLDRQVYLPWPLAGNGAPLGPVIETADL